VCVCVYTASKAAAQLSAVDKVTLMCAIEHSDYLEEEEGEEGGGQSVRRNAYQEAYVVFSLLFLFSLFSVCMCLFSLFSFFLFSLFVCLSFSLSLSLCLCLCLCVYEPKVCLTDYWNWRHYQKSH